MSGSFRVTSDESEVEVTSLNRLPFEPKTDELKSLRGAIQSAVRGVRWRPGFILSGTYSSSDRSVCDTENILFYNVGLSCFVGLSPEGIRFERTFQLPEAIDNSHRHYARYQLTRPDTPFSAWSVGAALLAWQQVPLSPIGEGTKPAPIWYALTDARIARTHRAAIPPAYGLRLSLTLPTASRASAVKLLKPLLDGVISAAHAHDGSAIDDVVGRVGTQLGVEHTEVSRRLSATHGAVLGQRRLLYPRAEGVQWNPADDNCVVAQVLLQRDPSATGWSLSGELFEVSPA